MTQERHYVPKVGDIVRLRVMSDYTAVGLPYWTRLHATGIDGDRVVCVRSLTGGEEKDGDLVTIPLSSVSAPVGWKERYTIHAAPDKVDEVLAWMKRGIVVRFSQYIGDGSTAYQPMDNSGQPHWKFGEVTDAIAAYQTKDLIQVVKLETVGDAFVPAPCRYCNGSSVHVANKAMDDQTASTKVCEKCGIHTGFSFTEPWHNAWNLSDNGVCPEVNPPGWCWVCRGSGLGCRQISELKGKERKAAIEQLTAKGWKVWYQKEARMWFMERETVVKDFGQEVIA